MARCVFRIAWAHPYTEPPAGKPRVLGTVVADPSCDPYAPALLGSGYSPVFVRHYGAPPPKPRRELSEQSRQRIRRKALRRRLQRSSPLFAAEMFADAVQARPDYFGTDDPGGQS